MSCPTEALAIITNLELLCCFNCFLTLKQQSHNLDFWHCDVLFVMDFKRMFSPILALRNMQMAFKSCGTFQLEQLRIPAVSLFVGRPIDFGL